MLGTLVIALVVCFCINVPIGYALGIASVACIVLGGGDPSQLIIIPQRIVASMNSFPLLAIMYFMVAGAVMELGGVSKRIINLASAFLGHIRGGLSATSIVSCTIFAAISGSTPATAAAIGSITIPEMVKKNYPADYSSAVVASSACLGVIIPPSITMVVFGSMSNTSVGKMLIGGILPGMFLSLLLLIVNYFFCRTAGYKTEPKVGWKERLHALIDAIWALLMPAIILGGIMFGIFTPTESAAVAIFYGLFVGFFVYRELTLPSLVPLFYKAALNSAMIMILIGTAGPFGWLMTTLDVPNKVSHALLSLSTNPTVIFMLIMGIYLILGTFMETAAIIMLTVPILAPIVEGLGIDMVHFGVCGVISLAIGMATPPVGISLFATCGISKVTLGEISAKVWPFLFAMIFGLAVLVLIPQITLVLPNIMFAH